MSTGIDKKEDGKKCRLVKIKHVTMSSDNPKKSYLSFEQTSDTDTRSLEDLREHYHDDTETFYKKKHFKGSLFGEPRNVFSPVLDKVPLLQTKVEDHQAMKNDSTDKLFGTTYDAKQFARYLTFALGSYGIIKLIGALKKEIKRFKKTPS
jgi:hypothetical protein